MNFGENLKKIRKSKKLSQEDLAAKINVSRQSVSKWETGDAYPEMNNLLELCKIFHCKLNDLVNDSIIDLDELDEDVKKSIITLKKEEQRKMKTLSKIISVIAKISKIVCYIAIPFIIAIMFATPFLISNIEVKNNELTWNSRNEKITIEPIDENIVLKINGMVIADAEKEFVQDKVIDIFNNNSKTLIISYIEVGLLTLLLTVCILSLIFNHLTKLFENLNMGETPFTLENVEHIKKMARLMIVTIILPNIGGIIFNLLLTTDIDMDFELFDLVEILFLFSLSYIFEYGRLIQLNSKGKIYGDTNE